jgi:cell division septation protein DedD
MRWRSCRHSSRRRAASINNAGVEASTVRARSIGAKLTAMRPLSRESMRYTAALPASRAGGWAVQLGAFKTVEEANKVRDRLKGAGFVAYVDKVDTQGATLWRVRAGPEADRGNADKLKGRIKDKLKMDGMVVTQQ